MTDAGPNDGDSAGSNAATHDRSSRSVAEARRYLKDATERPERIAGKRARIIELLSMDTSSVAVERALAQRAAASGALAVVARREPGQIADSVPVLVEELRTELCRTVPDENPDLRALSDAVQDQLVSSIAHVIATDPETVAETDGLTVYVDAISTDLDDGTIRPATRALFAVARERPAELVPAAETLGELVVHPDDAVQALSAGALGRLAEEYPDVVATTADGLRDLLGHDDETVQHNTVEALATLVRSRPDAVVPAADEFRGLLGHEEAAIQHNAAGVLGRLAEDHPDAVVPAVEGLETLRDHDDVAVRRAATGALAQLTRERSN